ncbi:MAG: hypothetical protein UX99_C0030G0003 [Candidatus Amesbacteria bacterium GW2011_GWB1_47_26]|uniref:Uncharacterized protein n=1 Tax=Candidatus Amesbacteria bacterium GW2011_GWC2_45_19 TaxID=1618366 RepID=A0A0G1M439_9BACT|nr:MAG: hypothetical protein UX05_C0004G0020 [Candidatus Amesbacteria bacterium GW2011_GWC2_45_19]KKU37536.1 MAG: hypothetical protein UX52_C0023G0009 [Candidatus Amesbacteria bacterium GW2011_GWA1_46_35]KKU69181.1 MAG: hypothetical protein UX93_C0002G0020 [Microgenomates group bacterium GW2011_GWC1_47_20]KKU73452.1 MAG: hypothetical protein UX99_C0030G0003 [Candidatus Amesbacteria bacterium GW2011_GWB1_47_26]
MNNKLVLQSIASDLKRVSQSLQRGSPTVASRFAQEVLRRKEEVDSSALAGYIGELLNHLDQAVTDAETAQMYSTLLQNYTLRHSSSASS